MQEDIAAFDGCCDHISLQWAGVVRELLDPLPDSYRNDFLLNTRLKVKSMSTFSCLALREGITHSTACGERIDEAAWSTFWGSGDASHASRSDIDLGFRVHVPNKSLSIA